MVSKLSLIYLISIRTRSLNRRQYPSQVDPRLGKNDRSVQRKHLSVDSEAVDMKRRQALLAGGSCLGALLSGCVGETAGPATGTPGQTATETASETATGTPTTETLTYDCDAVSRPASPGPDADPPGDVERYTYPARPESLSNQEMRSCVKRYERAYRLNKLRSRHGTYLEQASVFVDATDTDDAPDGAGIARVEYAYGARIEGDDGPIEMDSPTVYAAYYVDDDVVLRAVETGHRDDETQLIPDPMEQGEPVECF